MRKLSHHEIAERRLSVEQLKTAERFPIYAMLDNVRSLYNVGSIFRTADGARVGKLILCGYTPRPPRKEIDKTALGATKTVPWEHVREPRHAMHQLKAQRIRVCVLEHTNESIPYHAVTREMFPLCLVVGNEITGVSSEILAEADLAVDIPMFGMKQSLNAAVAFGIAIFEFVKILTTDMGGP